MSRDGSRIAFQSTADQLVLGDTNRVADVFVRDPAAAETTRINTSTAGEANDDACCTSMSADGSRIAFASHATGRVRVLRSYSRLLRATSDLVGAIPDQGILSPQLSGDGRYLLVQTSMPLDGGDLDQDLDFYLIHVCGE